MTQPKTYLIDGTGHEVLIQLNDIIDKLKNEVIDKLKDLSNPQVGPTEPNPQQPVLLWADTATGQLKVRNTSNTDWITLGTLDQTGLFVGQAGITSDKLANQAVTLSKIERGPAGTILVSRGSVSDPVWENVETARRNQDPALTGQGSDHDPIWRALPDNTFDGWQVGDRIAIAMSNPDFVVVGEDDLYGTASATATITSIAKNQFTFAGQGYMSVTDPDLFFNDHFSKNASCTGYVESNYYGYIDLGGRRQHDVTEHFYWAAYGFVGVRKITDERQVARRLKTGAGNANL